MRKQGSLFLILLYGGFTSYLYQYFPMDFQILLLLISLPLTLAILLNLSVRAISVDEAVFLRFTSTVPGYQQILRRKVILSNDGFSSLVRMILGLNFLAIASVLWNKYSVSKLSSTVSPPLSYLFGLGSLLVSITCITLSVTQPLMSVTFEKADGLPTRIQDDKVPYLSSHQGVDGWHKVAETSRRHNVHAKVDKLGQTFEIRTTWAEGHPHFDQRKAKLSKTMSGKL